MLPCFSTLLEELDVLVGGRVKPGHDERERLICDQPCQQLAPMSSMRLPNAVELSHKSIGVDLGFPFCREGIERFVSHSHILGDAPPIALRTNGVSGNIDREHRSFDHSRIMHR